MSEIVRADQAHALTVQMDYARTVSTASMLPDNYRGKPADIMLAVGLGQSMGLSPAESLYRISVIKGKPTASAELIAANVRKAGHKLRVLTDEQARSVKAIVVRADDPDFAFEVTRDMAWAQQMGLDRNDNYRKQPLTMLQWRAITAVARLACPEALYGVSYTPDEIETSDPRPARSGGIRSVMAEQVDAQPADEPDGITSGQLKKMGAAMRERGITERAEALDFVTAVIGREVSSRNELTRDEAGRVIDALEDWSDDTVEAEVVDAEQPAEGGE